jgi:polysaccharide export outer membrane protein
MTASLGLRRARWTLVAAAFAGGILPQNTWARSEAAGKTAQKHDGAAASNGGDAARNRDGADLALYPEYRIGPEDVLQIAVWNNEALSCTVPVRPDGMISMPLLSDVRASGLTPVELRELLSKRLSEYMAQPEVSVIVTDVRSYKVSVLGQVMRPGRYELKSWSTVLDLLALAGGFTDYASRSRIVILRSDGQTTERIRFDYDDVVSEHSEQVNLYLHAGDIVLVP